MHEERKSRLLALPLCFMGEGVLYFKSLKTVGHIQNAKILSEPVQDLAIC